jgi:hypothetical protein
MKVQHGLSTALLSVGLMVGAIAMSWAGPASVTVNSSPWTTAPGIASAGGKFDDLLLPSGTTTFDAPSVITFGSQISAGPTSGSDTFTGTSTVSALLDFNVTQNGKTDHFTVDGTLSGTVSNAASQAKVTFSNFKDLTTGQSDTLGTDPANGLPALFLQTEVGGVWVDQTASIPAPNSGQTITVYGFLSNIPELGSSVSRASMLVGGGLLGLLRRRRSRK